MNDGALRGLVWKESRQLLPLVLILLGVGLLLVFLWAGLSSDTLAMQYAGQLIPFILPALFAVGAAAVLVGQEKEQKTLWWLASLPTHPRRLILVKFAVAVVGLVIMWIACIALVGLTQSNTRYSSLEWLSYGHSIGTSGYVFLIVQSFFIMVVGFYTTWKFNNTFAGLLAILPISLLPFVVLQVVNESANGLFSPHVRFENTAFSLYGILFLAIVAVAGLAYRVATQTLAPVEPERILEGGASSWIDAWRPTNVGADRGDPYRFSISSLVWQSVHHSRWVLLGITSLILCGLVGAAVFAQHEWFVATRGMSVLLVLAGILGVSWLGVFAFTGDGSATRLRFLADRGASPTVVWIGRHLVGISILSSAGLLYWIVTYHLLGSFSSETQSPLLSVMTVTLVAAVIYSVSQWISQLTRMLAVSSVLAPVIAMIASYWLAYGVAMFELPWLVLLLLIALPMVATWLMMRRYMDGNRGILSWLVSIAGVGLFVTVPMVRPAFKIASYPRIATEVKTKALAAAKLLPNTEAPQPIAMHAIEGYLDSYQRSLVKPRPGDEELALYEKRTFNPYDLFRPPSGEITDAEALSIDSNVLVTMLHLASYQKVRFEANPTDEQEIERTGQWIRSMTDIVKGLRQSPRWIDQDRADLIEVWLTKLIGNESFRELRDRGFSKDAMAMLADQSARNEARRQAILRSWLAQETSRIRQLHHFGGYPSSWWDDSGAASSDPTTAWTQPWLKDRVADAGLRLIQAGSTGQPVEPILRELHQLVSGPGHPFVDGLYADRLRLGIQPDRPITYFNFHTTVPATQWYAPWEAQAKALALEFNL
ncbi:ABC transporter permease [Novipirellula artificiosorum]|uniref:ABC-2 family transporter protein n=1 Tax=Novipirellula artificiosorum TaxID=2528016 RepID=A0A5C6DFB6_9BACT|nr:ABC transporter permease [Novipirellula artificiosorum]TWU34431.1 ABC-2 family transporter protein [Novipirellula artificiosorum]